MKQEKSLLHVSTGAHSGSRQAPSDINPDKIYFVTGEFREPRQTEPENILINMLIFENDFRVTI